MSARHELEAAMRSNLVSEPMGPLPALEYEYRSAVDFVLREGEWFDPRPMPRDLPAGPPRMCYGNAIMHAAVNGLPYVEGFAWNGFTGGIAIAHAWNLDEDDKAVDSTWLDAIVPPQTRAYIGVRFSAARAHDATWHGDEAILLDRRRGYPIFRKKWTGEDSPGEDLNGLLVRMFLDAQADGHYRARSAGEWLRGCRASFGRKAAA